MMNYDQSEKSALRWAKQDKMPWPIVLEKDAPNVYFGKIDNLPLPAYLLIDKNGKLIAHGKEATMEKLEKLKTS